MRLQSWLRTSGGTRLRTVAIHYSQRRRRYEYLIIFLFLLLFVDDIDEYPAPPLPTNNEKCFADTDCKITQKCKKRNRSTANNKGGICAGKCLFLTFQSMPPPPFDD